MPRKVPEKTVYYRDELNDDFAGTNIRRREVDERFTFVRKNPIWRCASFVLYYVVAMPLIWLYERVFLGAKFVNKRAVKKAKGKPYFLYGNHTGFIDAFTPNLISFPRRNDIVVAADTVSIKGLKNITQMLGALPVPTHRRGMKKFLEAIEYYGKRRNITVYPEAHIWPYYTGVRQFKDVSFAYPIRCGAPTFAFFTAYTRPKGLLAFLRKANVTVYVSDPIYPENGLTKKEAQKDLRNKVYAFMAEKSALSDYNVIEYIKENAAKGISDSPPSGAWRTRRED
ncbi:MAG: hypothetical protein IJX91_03390 [Clostridia bacterium]|nr:hypothetical protein [Clostridia bacterium]